jgi:hypothetical protein
MSSWVEKEGGATEIVAERTLRDRQNQHSPQRKESPETMSMSVQNVWRRRRGGGGGGKEEEKKRKRERE